MKRLKSRLRQGFDASVDGAVYVVRRVTRLMAAIALLVAISATSIVIIAGMIEGRVAAQLPFGVGIEVPGVDPVEEGDPPSAAKHASHVPFASPTAFPGAPYLKALANEICPLIKVPAGALPPTVSSSARRFPRRRRGR